MTQSLETLRRAAKALKKAHAAGAPAALARAQAVLPDVMTLNHADALHVIAVEAGHDSWPKLKLSTEAAAMDRAARQERLKMALFFGQGWVVETLLAATPDLAAGQVGLMCALYDRAGAAAALARDPGLALRIDGVRSPILHLTFSQHWKGGGRIADQIAIAEMLVARGADVNDSYPAEPGSEHRLSALYGALGHAGNLEMARWLLERGADPNDDESLYHSTELGHAEGLRLLLAHGARPEGTNALPRALDFDNLEMVEMLLAAGANPNEGIADHPSGAPSLVIPGLHQAARRMCSAPIARALIAHGADGTALYQGHSAYALARMRGNAEVAQVLEEAGQATPLDPAETLLAAAAEGPVTGRIDPAALTDETRRILTRVLGFDGRLDHVKRLVALGIDPNWTDEQDMPAIHIAGWEGHADAVAWLLGLDPDLAHRNMYGGDLLGTVIHGAEFCPARDRRDHLACAEAVLAAGARLHRHDVVHCGVPALAEFLADWAEAHPDRVVEDTP